MTDQDFSKLMQNFLYCRNNDLLGDDVGDAAMHIFNAGISDDFVAGLFQSRVDKHKYHQAFNPSVPFRSPRLTNGNYRIGFDSDGKEIRSQIQYMNAHNLTIAGSGAGKTTFSYSKIVQIAPHVRGMFLFDLRKREFGGLQQPLERIGIRLVILDARDLKINPLQIPSGVTLQNWIPQVADMLVGVLVLPPRATKLLQTTLFGLYRKFDSRRNECPTLFDLFEAVKQDKNSNPQARMAVLDNLEPVLLSLGPKVLAYRRGWPSEVLAKHHIVFELAGVSEVDKNLLLNSIILSEFSSRIAKGISNARMDLWICLDEAQRICSAGDQGSAIADLIGLIRGTGIGLDLSVQSANGLLPQVISNTATKVLGRCGSMADYTAAGSSMGLSSEQIHWAQMNLKPGMFIGQLGEGNWRYPFVFNVPLLKLPKAVQSCQDLPDSLAGIPTVYASEFDGWGKTPVINSVPTSQPPTSQTLFYSVQEYQFCKAVSENPMLPSSQYSKLAGIKLNSAKHIREALIGKQYIRSHTVNSGGKGRSSLLLEVLPAGQKALKKYEANQCF